MLLSKIAPNVKSFAGTSDGSPRPRKHYCSGKHSLRWGCGFSLCLAFSQKENTSSEIAAANTSCGKMRFLLQKNKQNLNVAPSGWHQSLQREEAEALRGLRSLKRHRHSRQWKSLLQFRPFIGLLFNILKQFLRHTQGNCCLKLFRSDGQCWKAWQK